MKYIILRGKDGVGKSAIVDDEDFEWLNQSKWYLSPRGYSCSKTGGRKNQKTIYMHKLISGSSIGLKVDHINGNKLDNRRENLRICTHAENIRNSKIQVNNTSGFKGVSWNKDKNKYKAYINIKRKQIFLGYFDKKIEAAMIYNKAALEHFKEFARLNNI